MTKVLGGREVLRITEELAEVRISISYPSSRWHIHDHLQHFKAIKGTQNSIMTHGLLVLSQAFLAPFLPWMHFHCQLFVSVHAKSILEILSVGSRPKDQAEV